MLLLPVNGYIAASYVRSACYDANNVASAPLQLQIFHLLLLERVSSAGSIGPGVLECMPNPQLGGQFAPKATFVGGDEAQSAASNTHSSSKLTGNDPECSFKPLINRNIPDFGRMHAILARQLAANKEARKFQQVNSGNINHEVCF